MNLTEILVSVAISAGFVSLCLVGAQGSLARQELESASRELWLGLERARNQAEQQGKPCALQLGGRGWQAPALGDLASCDQAEVELFDVSKSERFQLSNNFSSPLVFTANGLVLGGGTAILKHSSSGLSRCLVISLPLGITRVGNYAKGSCLPDA